MFLAFIRLEKKGFSLINKIYDFFSFISQQQVVHFSDFFLYYICVHLFKIWEIGFKKTASNFFNF